MYRLLLLLALGAPAQAQMPITAKLDSYYASEECVANQRSMEQLLSEKGHWGLFTCCPVADGTLKANGNSVMCEGGKCRFANE